MTLNHVKLGGAVTFIKYLDSIVSLSWYYSKTSKFLILFCFSLIFSHNTVKDYVK